MEGQAQDGLQTIRGRLAGGMVGHGRLDQLL